MSLIHYANHLLSRLSRLVSFKISLNGTWLKLLYCAFGRLSYKQHGLTYLSLSLLPYFNYTTIPATFWNAWKPPSIKTIEFLRFSNTGQIQSRHCDSENIAIACTTVSYVHGFRHGNRDDRRLVVLTIVIKSWRTCFPGFLDVRIEWLQVWIRLRDVRQGMKRVCGH